MSNGLPDSEREDDGQDAVVPRRVRAFDVRNVIAGLIGFYGVVLIIMGLVADTAEERAKTGGLDANLWAGIAMVVFAAALGVWSRLRPVVIE